MLCRKHGTVLADTQITSVVQLPVGTVVKDFAHPFAKPIDVWRKLYVAMTHPGESVFDPFMGTGSSTIAALRYGLKPYGCEINQSHFNSATVHLKAEYMRMVRGDVKFI